jgi:hypothetical protein
LRALASDVVFARATDRKQSENKQRKEQAAGSARRKTR